MCELTERLNDLNESDPSAMDRLLPLVYAELRNLASAKLANERPGQTLQATALVHDTYYRCRAMKENREKDPNWPASFKAELRKLDVDGH